jgi:N-acetylmuramoyl-L-alanine amidase
VIADQVSALVISCALAIAAAASHRVAAPSRSALAPLAGKVVTIDPGHDGGNFNDPTAINRLVNDGNGLKACDTTGTAAPNGYRETDFNWYVALDLRLALIHEGATVVLTRHSNTGVGPCITQRAAIGNQAHSDVALSIHADGGPPSGSGFAILTPAPIPGDLNGRIIGPSSRFAIDLRDALERIGHLNPSNYDGVDGIAPRTDLGGLNLSLVPKVFVEVGNMQNPADEAPMETSRYRRRVAAALASAITRFLAG